MIDEAGKRVDKHHGLVEEQSPRRLEMDLGGQIALFEAIACLPQAPSFPNWAGLRSYYDSQKRLNPNVGNALFKITFSCAKPGSKNGSTPVTSSTPPALPGATSSALLPVKVKAEPRDPSDPVGNEEEAKASQALQPSPPLNSLSQESSTCTNIVLPARFRALFPTHTPTPLASIPCPGCREPIAITITHGNDASGDTLTEATMPTQLPTARAPIQPPPSSSLPPGAETGTVKVKPDPDSFPAKAPPTITPDLRQVKQEPTVPMETSSTATIPDPSRVKQEPGLLQASEGEIQCVFTGRPYQPLGEEQTRRRNEELQRSQEDMRRRFLRAKPNSPQYTAQRLPVASARLVGRLCVLGAGGCRPGVVYMHV